MDRSPRYGLRDARRTIKTAMIPCGVSGFWAGGLRSCLNEIHREESETLAKLSVALSAEIDQVKRQEIKIQIKATKAHFRQKVRQAQASMFTRA